ASRLGDRRRPQRHGRKSHRQHQDLHGRPPPAGPRPAVDVVRAAGSVRAMLHRRSILRVASFALIGALTLPSAARSDEQIGHAQAVVAKNGMVVAQEATAAHIGADILQQGGNAVDAAVAVGFALAVTYPRAGNLGGGGFMLIHQASGNDTAIDYRETAPAAISNKTFLDAQGNADPQKSRDSALAIGVPGTVEGLAFAARRHGSGPVTA